MVVDYNDCPPVFSKTSYQLSINESRAKAGFELPVQVPFQSTHVSHYTPFLKRSRVRYCIC